MKVNIFIVVAHFVCVNSLCNNGTQRSVTLGSEQELEVLRVELPSGARGWDEGDVGPGAMSLGSSWGCALAASATRARVMLIGTNKNIHTVSPEGKIWKYDCHFKCILLGT